MRAVRADSVLRSARAARAVVGAALAFAALAAVLVGGSGCQRRTQLLPASADSTLHRNDSLAIGVRNMQQRWEDAQGGEEAARLTAELLRADLASHPNDPWALRAHAFLDSIDVGAELVADRRALAVNFFARSRPEGGSWPWLFWHTAQGADGRPLAGHDLKLFQIATQPGVGPLPGGIAILFGRRAAAGEQPLLMVWGPPRTGTWTPLQTLGADSLGGIGSGDFQAGPDSSIALVTRTYRQAPRFEECTSCPHVYTVRRFQWGATGFTKVEERMVPSPYSTFASLVTAMASSDMLRASQLASDNSVIDAARRYDLGALPRGVWRAAPATDESASEMVFFRGQTEAYRVTFTQRGADWVITGIVPTTRTIE